MVESADTEDVDTTCAFLEDGMASALAIAVRRGDVPGCARAVYAGAQVSALMQLDPPRCFAVGPALCAAAYKGHVDMCKLLLLLNADVSGAATGKIEPLQWAAYRGHTQTARVLLQSGAELEEARNVSELTALLRAVSEGHTETATMLLDAGAAIEATDLTGETALIIAARWGHTDTAAVLLDRGAATKAADRRGNTALLWAVRNRHADMANLLLDHDADPSTSTPDGRTTFDLATCLIGDGFFPPYLIARLDVRSAAAVLAANADDAEARYTSRLAPSLRVLKQAEQLQLKLFTLVRQVGAWQFPKAGSRHSGFRSCYIRVQLPDAGCTEGAREGENSPTLGIKCFVRAGGDRVQNPLTDLFAADYTVTNAPVRHHPNLSRTLGHFVDVASAETLRTVWEKDETPDCHALFVVFEFMGTPLQTLIYERRNRLTSMKRDSHGLGAAENAWSWWYTSPTSPISRPTSCYVDADMLTPLWPPVMSVAEFLVVMQRLLRAVLHLELCGIVHRGITPETVLLGACDGTPVDGGGTISLVKLSDFGDALDASAAGFSDLKVPVTVQNKGAFVGSGRCVAPEITALTEADAADGHTGVDFSKNDVFFVGKVAQFILTSGAKSSLAGASGMSTSWEAPLSCPTEISELVSAMLNPLFDDRITAKEALDVVNKLVAGPALRWQAS